MKQISILSIASIFMVAIACQKTVPQKTSDETAPSPARTTLSFPGGAVLTSNIQYGSPATSQTKFDIFSFPDENNPTPIVIYIHGGGFIGGDKQAIWADDPNTGLPTESKQLILDLLGKKVAFASINYTLLTPNNPVEGFGIRECMLDSKRALQFIRSQAITYNIDPEKVILMGGSAGAGTSFWIALSDDMATGTDPVLSQSTRVKAVIADNSQATYNIPEWSNLVYKNYYSNFTQQSIFDLTTTDRTLLSAGFPTGTALTDPALLSYYNEIDMLALMSSDDPELFITSGSTPNTIPTTTGEVNHNPYHSKALYDTAIAESIVAKVKIPQFNIDTQEGETKKHFILRKFGML